MMQEGKLKGLLQHAPYDPDIVVFGDVKAKIIGFPNFKDNSNVRVETEDKVQIDVPVEKIQIVLKSVEKDLINDKDFWLRFFGQKQYEKATNLELQSEILDIWYSVSMGCLDGSYFEWLIKKQYDVLDLESKNENFVIRKT